MAKSTPVESKQPDSKTAPDSGNKSPFIDGTTANEAYTESNKWFYPYFDPIEEFERIARNKPSDRIPDNLPRITDGTLAAIIQEDPKRIIQNLATGLVTCQDYPEYASVADLVHRHRLMPMYNRMGTALQKHWNMLGKAMTWGRSTSYTFFTNTNSQFHTDFVIPYVKDVITEKGKVYAPDSNISFMRSWYQKRDLKAILNRETSMEKTRPGYKSDWDLKLLEQFMNEGGSMKPANLQTPAEKEKGGDTGGYEVIHAFQTGIGAEFYSFCPRFQDGVNLRTKINKDPRGKMPLDFEYCNIDLSNPLGRGAVELSGGVQNLVDQQMQMFQFMTTLMMGPPLQVWGGVDKNSLKFKPNAVWDMGVSATNKVEPYVISDASMSQFSNNYSLLKSQIMQLNNSADTSVPAQAGQVGQSKTAAGVKNTQQRLGVSDNYLEKQHEAWFGAQSETSINLFFAEMTAEDSIELSENDREKLEGTPAEKFLKGENLVLNYGEVSDATFKFKTDAGSSADNEDAEQLTKMQEVITELGQSGPVLSYYLGQAGMKLNVGELYKQRFERMGLKNIDTILTKMEAKEAEAAKAQPFPIIDKPQIRLNSADLSPAALVAALQAGGVHIQDPNAAAAPSNQAQLDYQVEMAKAQAQAQAGKQQPTDPNELAMKQHELQLKQQSADDNSTKTALEVSKTAHQHALDIHNAAQGVQDTQFSQQQAVQQQQIDAQAAQQQGSKPSTTSVDNGQSQQLAQQPTQQPATQEQPDQTEMAPLQFDQGELGDEERQVAHALFQQGFTESDVEQAITMLRQGKSADEVMQVLRSKYANQGQ